MSTIKHPPLLNIYHWKGIDKFEQKITGQTEASSSTAVKLVLRHQGIIVKKIYKKNSLFSFKLRRSIKQSDITFFSRQLATMIAAGIPLVQCLEIIIHSHPNKIFAHLIRQIKIEVESGNTLAQALKQHPKHFSDLYCSLANAGEQSGALDEIFAKIALYKERIEHIKSKIKKAMFYPAAVLSVAIMVSSALLIFVVPQFETLFKNFGAELPYLTRCIITISQIVAHSGWIIFSGIFFAILGCSYLYSQSKKFTDFLDRISLKLPIVGSLLRKAAIARFARTLSITFAAGLPLVEALQTVAAATGNTLYANATLSIRDEVATGQQMHLAMKKASLFPEMAIQMIGVGEESGSLEQMLSKVADHYEGEVEHSIDNIGALLEPAIMVILGILVGGLVIAMYLPIFKLGSIV